MVAAISPSISFIVCPNGHDVAVPAEPGFQVMNGAGVVTRSVRDALQDCPTCGPFRRLTDGSVEINISVQNPISIRPIAWAVDELLARLRQLVPDEEKRTAMAQDGSLHRALEAMRDHWEARGVDYDAVIEAVVEAEELVGAIG